VISRQRSWLRRVGRLLPPSVAVLGLMWLAPAGSPGLLDDTPPSVNYTIDGINGTNGWYRGSTSGNYVVVHWTVSDPDSSISSTSGCEPAIRIDDPNPGTTRTCSATSAGGTTAVTTKTIKIDSDPPSGVVANAARAPDHGAWYRQPVGIGWNGSDATSGIASCTAITYSGPDSGSAAPNGTCIDVAGNVSATVAYPLKYDSTAPTVTATPDRQANPNGWYKAAVTISWAATDAVSGVSNCTAPQTYAGPDSGGAVTSGTCTDQAGNASTVAVPVKYDATAPTGVAPTPARAPDQSGWYNHAVGISWSGNDQTSGISSCSALTYSGPDSGSAGPGGTCTDKAGNQSASVPFSLKYDATAPSVTATPDRQPNTSGWYRAAVTIDWNGSDSTSGVAGCSPDLNYSGPDSGSAAPSGTCTDNAGNVGSKTFPLRYDSTSPIFAPSPDRAPNANGWYRNPVTVTWNGSDATSGIASCPNTSTYSTGDSANAALSATCTDQAGNSASASFALKYDSTPPVFAPSPDRAPNANGWYRNPVTVTWNGSDATSGIASCPSSATYSGPDSGAAAPGATCTDRAGNSASASFALKYDSTPPVAGSASPARSPDVNGWYNHQVAINWTGSDATSGPVTCTSLAYNGPDGGNIAPTGTCTDQAGNTSAPLALPAAIQFDATPPTAVQGIPARGPDHNGWYTTPVAITWSGSDATSGIAGCSSLTYSGPDSGSAAPSGGCADKAGNTAAVTLPLQYDATAPDVIASPTRSPDSNGWYDRPVVVAWAGSDPASGVENCTDASTYGGPDSAGVTLAGTCTDKAGNSGSGSFHLSYDGTAPAVSARAERGPDHDGWYNRPVKIDFVGTDALSGIDSCTSMTYSGPFIKSLEPVGSCRDRAGNKTSASFPLDYDAEAPKLSGLAVESEVGADVVRWKSSSPDDIATVRRAARGGGSTTVFRGSGATFADKGIKPGLEYRYSVQTQDQAGNESRRLSRLALPKVLTLQTRGYVPRTAGAPVLRLPSAAGASYYHVQLFRRGKRVLAAWPLRPELALRPSWRWAGHSYRLTAGQYRWFAWAGFGPRSAARYKLLGSARFIVAQP
jgi:large repetitive protein